MLHVFNGYEYSHNDSVELKLVLKGIARLNPHCEKRAFTISPQILLDIHRNINLQNVNNVIFWCLYLFSFFMMARKSQLVPNTIAEAKKGNQIKRSDVVNEDTGLIVTVKWSKTIQFGERVLEIAMLAIPDSPLCSLNAWQNMINMVPANDDSLAFVFPNGKPVLYSNLQTNLKRMIKKTGIDPENFSSHSFCGGGATWAFKAQVPAELIQLQCDWESDAYKKYLEIPMSSKVLVCYKMKSLISELK